MRAELVRCRPPGARGAGPALGAYGVSDSKMGSIAQDANVSAVLFGVAPTDRVATILATLQAKGGLVGGAG